MLTKRSIRERRIYKMKQKELKKLSDKGITLIALVITIIVLLILAGVSIAMLTGDNGILTQAQKAKKETEEAAKEEAEMLKKIENMIAEGNGEEYEKVEDSTPGDITDGGKADGTEDNHYKVRSIEDFLVVLSESRKDGLTDKYVDIEVNLDFNNPNSYSDPNNTDLFEDYNEDGTTEGIMNELTNKEERGLKNGYEFAGILDGKGHTISNMYLKEELLYYSAAHNDYQTGVFHENTGIIKNLNLQGEFVVTINELTTAARVGGIVGQNKHGGELINCVSDIDINVKGNNLKEEENIEIAIGGITSENEDNNENTIIDRCIYKGNLNCEFKINNTVSGNYHTVRIGGIVGDNESIVINSINEGTVSTTKNTEDITSNTLYIAGIVGKNNDFGIVENCANTGEVKGISTSSPVFVAGIVATAEDLNTCIIKNVYNSGKISADTSEDIAIAGIIADGYGIIDNCYNIGTLETQNSSNIKKGAIVGDRHSGAENTTITNCYYKNIEGLYGIEGEDDAGIIREDNLTQTQVLQRMNVNVDTNNASSSRKWYKLLETNGSIRFEIA